MVYPHNFSYVIKINYVIILIRERRYIMKHIPNLLSMFRILLIPLYIYYIVKLETLSAGLILIVSAFTDILDGYLARTYGWITQLGKVLDPVADKLTQTAICLSFIFLFQDYILLFWIIIIKEGILMLGSAYMMKQGIKLKGARWFGKVGTVLFYAIMILFVLFPNIPQEVKLSLMLLLVGLSLLSLWMYGKEGIETLKIKKQASSE